MGLFFEKKNAYYNAAASSHPDDRPSLDEKASGRARPDLDVYSPSQAPSKTLRVASPSSIRLPRVAVSPSPSYRDESIFLRSPPVAARVLPSGSAELRVGRTAAMESPAGSLNLKRPTYRDDRTTTFPITHPLTHSPTHPPGPPTYPRTHAARTP